MYADDTFQYFLGFKPLETVNKPMCSLERRRGARYVPECCSCASYLNDRTIRAQKEAFSANRAINSHSTVAIGLKNSS